MTESIRDYLPISVPYFGAGWGGLEPSTGALMDGSIGDDQWFYAVGSHEEWHGGIPSYANPDANYYPAQRVTELYTLALSGINDFKDSKCRTFSM